MAQQFWLVVGSEKSWEVAFENNNIWGLKDYPTFRALWELVKEGDGLLIYVPTPISGVVGFGQVVTKFKQTNPLWPDEIKQNQVIWPLRFEFNVEYCLPPHLWKEKKYVSKDLQTIARTGFHPLS